MNFFTSFYNSIYNPQFYQKVKEQTVGRALLYFYLLTLILSILVTLFHTADVSRGFDDIKPQLQSLYPSDLEVRIDQGQVSINQPEPYIIPSSTQLEKNHHYRNLLVIDTTTPFSQKQFDDYDTQLWLTKDTLFMHNSSQMRTIDLSNFDSLTLNKNVVNGWTDKIYQYKPPILLGIGLIILLVMHLKYLFNLIILLIVAIVIWLVAKKLSPDLTYKKSYIVAVYAATAGVLLNTVLDLFAPSVKIPFLMSIITILVFVCNFMQTPKVKKSSVRKSKPSVTRKKK